MMAEKTDTKTTEQNQSVFTIEKIYVDDISLEVPNTPNIFLEQGESKVDMQIRTESAGFGKNLYKCSVIITVSAKLQDERTVFLVEISQSGIFQIGSLTKEMLELMLGVTCPNILYPYAREMISNIIDHAGFPPVLLAPINFEVLYLQQHQTKEASAK
jgi:preprotein translocase subunit SecB